MSTHLETPSAVARGADTDLESAATAMEAHFLRRMLAEVRSSSPGLLDGGIGGRMFSEMLDEALADSMADAGGIGLAGLLIEQLGEFADPGPIDAPPTSANFPATAPSRPEPALAPGGELPVHARVSSTYGRRVDPIHGETRFHAGIDLAAPEGTPVAAAFAGTVIRAGVAGGYGNLVVVDHGGGTETRYAHLSAIDVSLGQRVAPAQVLGRVGSTGRATGPHLHFEVRRHGKSIDPADAVPGLKSSGG